MWDTGKADDFLGFRRAFSPCFAFERSGFPREFSAAFSVRFSAGHFSPKA